MAEITTKENETGEIVIETASKPTVLTEEQKVVFTDLIKSDTPYLQDQISQIKRDFPEEFASVSPFSDSEISEFSDLVSEDFQDKLTNYEKSILSCHYVYSDDIFKENILKAKYTDD